MVDKDGNDKKSYIRMEGNKVYKYAVRAMIESAEKAMEDAQITEKDIDMLIPHQANSRIIDAIAKRVNMPDEKVVRNLQYLGNTSSASIPVALDQVRKDGRLKDGDVLLVAAFGGGFTWGGLVIKM
ncbi:MAG: mercuric reductase [Candidatus Delongbacteria bacterium]|nr:mercuric reductase [Candidatus Delongbacteria bacterium]